MSYFPLLTINKRCVFRRCLLSISLSLFLFFSLASGIEGGRIKGKVISETTGEPIHAANVFLKNTFLGSATDSLGIFLIEKIPPGEYELFIQRLGYRNKELKHLTVQEGKTINLTIRLTPEPFQFREEVTVTATRKSSPVLEVPASVDIITLEKMETRNPQNLAEVLQHLQGVFVKDYGGPGNIKSLSLRGSSSEQVLVLLDGQRLNDPQSGSVDFSNLSLEGVEKVEIVRGGLTALYGADAIGGVVNIITRKPRKTRTGTNGHLRLSRASFHTSSLETSLSKSTTLWNLFSAFRYFQSRGDFPYQDNYGQTKIRKNNDISSIDLFFRLERKLTNPLSPGNLILTVKSIFSERGYPGEIEPYFYHARFWNQNSQINLTYNRNITSSRNELHLQAYYFSSRSRYKNDELLIAIDTRSISHSSGLEVEMETPFNPGITLIYGGGLRLDQAEINSPGNPKERLATYLYIVNNTTFNPPLCRNIVLVPSLRYDHNSDFGFRISPRMGITISWGRVWRLVLRSSAGNSYRAPTFNDLYWPEDAWAKGNPDLKPEIGHDWDVGLRLLITAPFNLYLESSYFHNQVKGLILWQEERGLWRPENLSSARMQGVESRLSITRILKFLSLSCNYTYLDARNLSKDPLTAGKVLIYRPRHTLNTSLEIQIKRFQFFYQYQFVSRRFTDKVNLWDKSLPPYQVSNAGITYKTQWKNFPFQLNLQVKNIFQEDYRIIKNMPVPGREFRCDLKINF